jgi:hypothetical protein
MLLNHPGGRQTLQLIERELLLKKWLPTKVGQ